MTRPLRNLISAVTLAALTGLLVLAATQWTDVFFRFYPAFSRWILGVLAGVTSVTSFPLWEPGLCLIVLWGIISLIRSLVRHHFLRWLSGLLLTLCGAAFFFMAVWGLNYFAPPMSDRLGLETQERTPAELREVTAYFLQKANETAPLVERDADGVIAASDLSQLGRQAGAGYETLAKTTDCFDGSTARVKTLLSSKWFGKTGTTGIFIAFTGESSISSTTFTASVPFTMCHEIGHRMAFARENEANFAAFLACEAMPALPIPATTRPSSTATMRCARSMPLRQMRSGAARAASCAPTAPRRTHTIKKWKTRRSPRSRIRFTTATCRRSAWNPAASPTVRWSIC